VKLWQLKEMQHRYPHDYPTIVYEIESKHHWIDFMYDMISQGKCERALGDSYNVGYVMLDNDQLQKTFQPMFDAMNLDLKILSVYIHYASKDGKFTIHEHDKPHGVYYLQAPTKSGILFFPDFGEHFEPEPNHFRLIPKGVLHGIDTHQNEMERIAITFQFEDIKF